MLELINIPDGSNVKDATIKKDMDSEFYWLHVEYKQGVGGGLFTNSRKSDRLLYKTELGAKIQFGKYYYKNAKWRQV